MVLLGGEADVCPGGDMSARGDALVSDGPLLDFGPLPLSGAGHGPLSSVTERNLSGPVTQFARRYTAQLWHFGTQQLSKHLVCNELTYNGRRQTFVPLSRYVAVCSLHL